MSSLRRVGVDTGGTFTDCVLVDYAGHRVVIAKVPSEPSQPQDAILAGVRELAAGPVESVTHGTTIATNAVITGDVARVGLITTRGFRDVLEIGTQQRGKLYDLRQRPRPPMVTRDLRLEVGGRIAATGEEIEPLDRAEIEAVVDRLLDAGVEAIAIAGLFSFLNPAHERIVQDVVRERAPELYVGRSSEISQEPREYPRFATAAVNAALAPRIDPYVRRLEASLDSPLFVMQSNGGIATADRSVGERVHQLILSGPAAGVAGAAREAQACGYQDCITFDVGGTSADIGVVLGGAPRTATEMTLPNGVPCTLANIEIETIGAGGGSIAWIDPGGALNVGPQSAGAEPGPACYGRGGTAPTATDAHLVLGRLPGALIGGELPLDAALARDALAGLARELGTTVEAAASGALAVLEANMAGAMRRAAARHGDDLRDFVLVAGGGAGPLHAASIMLELGMPAAIVPRHPGLLSALGLLAAHIRHDLTAPLVGADPGEAFAALEAQAAAALDGDRVAADARRLERSLDIRYLGQEYAVRVPVAADEPTAAAVERFHGLHERTFGHSAPGEPTELVAARVVAIGLREMPRLRPELPETPGAPRDTRPVQFADAPVDAAVWDRAGLAAGQVVHGPAVIEQLDATTVVPPGCTATVHESSALILRHAD
jgi:N-methylhydantoinase A